MSLCVTVHQTPEQFPSTSFFHSHAFITTNYSAAPTQFILTENKVAIAQLFVCIDNNIAHSLSKAPFGGINSIKTLPTEAISYFYNFIFSYLKENNISALQLSLPPNAYTSFEAKKQLEVLRNLRETQTTTDYNYHLAISEDVLRTKLHASEKNKLNKSIKAGFIAHELSPKSLQECYDLIVHNRSQKGYPITMTLEQLERIIQLPEFHLFGLFHNTTLIAVTVLIEISTKIAYNFYMADNYDYRSYSPLVMLNEYIYNWCQQKQIAILDLGTASEKGIMNSGLAKFKLHLGAIETEKARLSITL